MQMILFLHINKQEINLWMIHELRNKTMSRSLQSKLENKKTCNFQISEASQGDLNKSQLTVPHLRIIQILFFCEITVNVTQQREKMFNLILHLQR